MHKCTFETEVPCQIAYITSVKPEFEDKQQEKIAYNLEEPKEKFINETINHPSNGTKINFYQIVLNYFLNLLLQSHSAYSCIITRL